jgi:hypothetical protein
MSNKKLILSVAAIAILLVSLLGYTLLFTQLFTGEGATNEDSDQSTLTPTSTVNPADSPTSTSNPSATTDNSNSGSSTSGSASTSTSSQTTETVTVHEQDHEDPEDYVWNSSDVIDIALNTNSITTTSPTAIVEGSKITLTSAANYRISGTLTDGQIIVNTQDEATVRLILANVGITCSTSAPIYVENAKKTIIILEENTINTVKDAKTGSTTEPNAVIFSNDDLTIYGTGKLTVAGNNNDAIASKDGLIIKSGTITVTSLDDGIRGKDYLIVKDGTITVNAGGDGLKSDNADNSTKGYIDIEGSVLTVTSGADAIDAQTDVTVTGGQITVTSGGGSSSYSSTSTKGIKAVNCLIVDSGIFTINSADDALHSNNTLIVNGGTFTISTGDDAMHADKTLIINSGAIAITKCYEGIESANLTINDGTIHINSSDDGLNGAGGNDGSGNQPGPGGFGGQNTFAAGNYNLWVNGGYIVITAGGDGIDINGDIVMTAGTIIINGPTANDNGAIDYDSTFQMTGGFIVGVGSAGMALAPSSSSTQCSILLNLRTTYAAGTLIHIETSTGSNVLTYQTSKVFQSIVLCAPTLTKGTTYNVYLGGSSTGTLKDGIYQNGVYTAGTKLTTFTISAAVTKLNNL